MILISACLFGYRCRWHGKIVKSKSAQKLLSETGDKPVFICPEMLGGLSCPRPPAKRKKGRVYETCPDKKYRKSVTGREITEEFERGAKRALEIAILHNIKKAILAKWSPSCDVNGITGRLLKNNGIEIINTF